MYRWTKPRLLRKQWLVNLTTMCSIVVLLMQPNAYAQIQNNEQPPPENGGNANDPQDTPPPRIVPRSITIPRDDAQTVNSDESDEAGYFSVVPMQIQGSRGRRYTGRRI